MNELISETTAYIEYLKANCNLEISMHFSKKIISALPDDLLKMILPYNTHNNPYCIMVKAADGGFSKCRFCQGRVIAKCGTSKEFFGTCHAGVHEYVHAVYLDKKAVGFVCVSGYRGKEPRRADGYYKELWRKYLKEEEIPVDICRALIPPLCRMVELLLESLPDDISQESEYNLMLRYINDHHNKTGLEDLCRTFHRSRSYISHIFKKKTGMTLKSYCNRLKTEDAKRLLSVTDMPITEIAFAVGFSDVSYFIYVFRNFTGITPLQWRKLNK